MTYTHGHHESVLRSHTWRTAENSSAYLLPYLRPGQSLLDVGCGPGTITADLALLVAPGDVVGFDVAPDVVAQAAAHAERTGPARTCASKWATSSPCPTPTSPSTWSISTRCCSTLGSPRPRWSRCAGSSRPDGLVAARDSDYSAFTWAPRDPLLERWLSLYLAVTERNGHDARIGPRLAGLARAAGFDDIEVSSSTWTYADPESRDWWGSLWADRVRYSRFAEQAVEYGLSTTEELEEIATGWRRWADSPDGVFVVPHVEILARG